MKYGVILDDNYKDKIKEKAKKLDISICRMMSIIVKEIFDAKNLTSLEKEILQRIKQP